MSNRQFIPVSQHAWRLSLTERCNYKCFFCHHEGFAMEEKRQALDVEALYTLMAEGIGKGYQDITFTGGEPLYERKGIAEILQRLNSDGLTPNITIGTNCSMIDDALLAAVEAYKGNFKFNCSLHAVDSDTYCRIIDIPNPRLFDVLVQNIQKITQRKIMLKLNVVLLRGINNSPAYLEKIIDFALRHHVYGVKFLELLVTNKLTHLYDYYCEVESVEALLGDKIELRCDEIKRKVYTWRGADLVIELQKCPCRVGCKECVNVAGRMLTSDWNYYPCFTSSVSPLRLKPGAIDESFAQGDRIIKGLAKRYENSSPIIIAQPKIVERKREYFYYPVSFPGDIAALELVFTCQGWGIESIRVFQEIYYAPATLTSSWQNYKQTLKLYQNSYNQAHYQKVMSIITYPKEGDFYADVVFLTVDGPEEVVDLDLFAQEMATSGFVESFRLNWRTIFLAKGRHKLSIGQNVETGQITILSRYPLPNDLLEGIKIENINCALLKHLGFDYGCCRPIQTD